MSRYAVVDLEMCGVPKNRRNGYAFNQEIIEIGAVKLDDSFGIADEFKTFVAPQYGFIDSYIQGLTGISNEDTAAAPVMEAALEMFLEWLGEDTVMVAWSTNDAYQLRTEAQLKGIESQTLDAVLEASVDSQMMFSEKMNTEKVYKLSEALAIAGITYDEGAHEALVDARNTAMLFGKMMSDENFTLSPYILNEASSKGGFSPFADLLAGFGTAVCC